MKLLRLPLLFLLGYASMAIAAVYPLIKWVIDFTKCKLQNVK